MSLSGRLLVVVGALLLPVEAAAQPFPPGDLPPELSGWVDWVLDDVPGHGCVRHGGTPVCVWPGRLDLALGETGGTFRLQLAADRAADVPLPGDAQRWPQDVSLDGRPAPVVDRGGVPVVRVSAGAHEVRGSFGWPRLPDVLSVPPSIAIVDLTLSGRPVALPRRDQAGTLWLRDEAGGPAVAGETLRLQVFRKVMDGIPVLVETVLQMEVSGKAREIDVTGALLPDAVPLAVRGDLPARIDAEGRLRVQVRAGRHRVSVLSRIGGRPEALQPPEGAVAGEPAGWPAQEVWVFEADERLRQVELSGPTPVDASRTDLPDEWRSLPAFLVEPGGRLVLNEVRRGQPEAPPDALTLSREMWLDLDGDAWTVRDTFGGAAHRTWRLDLLEPGQLGRASVGGQDQLVTADPQTGRPGVEVRQIQLQVLADSRVPRDGAMKAVGWSADVEQLAASVHLPPGWTLLSASGVDTAPQAWTARWTLLGFFFVLIVALAVGKMFGRPWALLALGAMVLSYDEPGAPEVAWLVLLGAIALRRVASDGWLGRIARIAWLSSALVLALMLVSFAVGQVREALYPQVGSPRAARLTADLFPAAPMTAAPQDMAVDEEADAPAAAGRAKRKLELPSSVPSQEKEQRYRPGKYLEQDPHAVLQTGPGVPSWTWRLHRLGWSGPVSHEQVLRLWLVSPGLNRVVALVRLAALFALFAVLLGWRRRRPAPPTAAEAMPGAALLLAMALAGPAAAQDGPGQQPEMPGPELLEQMKTKLTRPPACDPDCVATSSLSLRIDAQRLVFTAEVHAQAEVSWPMPGPSSSWVPGAVTVDGAAHPAVARLADGFLHVRLRPGVHRVELSGPAPAQDSLTLQLPERPYRARVDAPEWEVVGLREHGPSEGSIQLTRRLARANAAHAEGVYPPWLEVERTIHAGVSWRTTTRVRRVSPPGSPIALRIPLLPGESVTEGGFEVENGELVLSLGREQQEAQWSGTLEPQPAVTLRAPEGRPWSEVWRLQCGVVWQCSFDGLVPVDRASEGVHEPVFRPWPGETLALAFAHPAGVPGQTLTIDSVSLEVTPGSRLEKSTLTLAARASRDEPLVLRLPADAEVQSLTLDGAVRPTRSDDGQVRVTVPAGAHTVVIAWQQPRGMGIVYGVPRVELGRPAVNLTTALHVPDDRWLLFVHGPSWGPAVLFWGYLLVVIAAAWGLARVPGSPLSTAAWVLLALGLTQVEPILALLVAGFFMAMAWRGRRPPASAPLFDLLQLGLAFWSLLALGILYGAIHDGLLLTPDMQVEGNGSTGQLLRWYVDRADGTTPAAAALTLPLWLYRGAMLAWALWLALSLLRWTAWAWRSFNEGGLWRPLRLGTRRPSRSAIPARPAPVGPDRPADTPAAPGPEENR